MRTARPALKSFGLLFPLTLPVFPVLFGGTNLWAFSLGVLILAAAFSLQWFRRDLFQGLFRTELDPWIAAYSALFLLSTLFSRIPYASWVEAYKLAAVLCAFFAARHYCTERTRFYRLTETLVLLGGGLSLVGLLQFAGGLPKHWWSDPSFLTSTYVNHNHFAGLLVLLLPVSMGLALAERNLAKKTLFIFLCALMGVAFAFTLSRGAWIALCVSAVCMMWMLYRRRLISSLIPFGVLVLLVVFAVLMFGTAPLERRFETLQLLNQQEELSMRYRWLTWKGTLPMIGASPWVGWGPGTFAHAFLPFRPAGFSMRPVHAHNDLLQLAAECGLPATLLVLGMVFVFFRAAWRVVRLDDSRLRIGVGSGVMAGTAGLLVHALFDFNFHVPANWLLSAVAAGMVLSMGAEDRVYDRPPLSVVTKTLVSCLLPVLLGAGLFLGLSDYHLWEAKSLLKEGGGKRALEAAQASLAVNPLDPEAHYLRGFLLAQKKESAQALRDLDAAIARDRFEPAYDLAKARVLAAEAARKDPRALVALYRAAHEKDPNNSWLAWTAAKDLLESGGSDAPLIREEAERLLRRAIEADPSYAEKSFEALWRHRKDVGSLLAFHRNVPSSLEGLVPFLERMDLWRHHRPYRLRLAGIDPDSTRTQAGQALSAGPSSRSFTLDDFTHTGTREIHQRALFHSNGELVKKVDLRGGPALLTLEAKGSASKGVYPVLYVKIDGKLMDELYVDSPDFKDYRIELRAPLGAHLLGLEYVNDVQNVRKTSEDRNLWIRRVSLTEA